jgi:hypothetical protein
MMVQAGIPLAYVEMRNRQKRAHHHRQWEQAKADYRIFNTRINNILRINETVQAYVDSV